MATPLDKGIEAPEAPSRSAVLQHKGWHRDLDQDCYMRLDALWKPSKVCSHAASLHFAGSGLPAGEPSWERCTVWSMREATNTRIILALTSTMSSQSRKMLQPSLRAVLITYLAFPSRSWADAPGVTTARLMHLGSTADSRSTCKMHHR